MSFRIPTIAIILAFIFTGCASAGAVENTSSEEASNETPMSLVTEIITLDEALETADSFAADVSNFESQRARTIAQVQRATTRALEVLDGSPTAADVRESTRAWRTDWDAVREEVNTLAARYAAVSATAVGYFHHLDAQTANITNDNLRVEEQERNDEIAASWSATSNEAVQALRIVRANLNTGDDLHVTMLNASLRSGFDAHVERLRTLGEDTEDALEALRALTEEGEKLVGSVEEDSETIAANEEA